MKGQNTVAKWLAYGVALLLVAAVNYYVLGPMPMALPALLPVAAVGVGTLEGAGFGAGFGGFAGLIMASLGHAGLVCIPLLSVIGWLSGLAAQYVLRRDIWGHLLCCLVTMVCWEGWQVCSRLLAHEAPLAVLMRVAIPELLWTMLLTIPVYWVGQFCCARYGRICHERFL